MIPHQEYNHPFIFLSSHIRPAALPRQTAPLPAPKSRPVEGRSSQDFAFFAGLAAAFVFFFTGEGATALALFVAFAGAFFAGVATEGFAFFAGFALLSAT